MLFVAGVLKRKCLSLRIKCVCNVSQLCNKCVGYCRWWSMAESSGNETCCVLQVVEHGTECGPRRNYLVHYAGWNTR